MTNLVGRKLLFPCKNLFLSLGCLPLIGPKIKEVEFSRSLALDHQICKEVAISILKQAKATLLVFEEGILVNEISTMVKWKFAIPYNRMVS